MEIFILFSIFNILIRDQQRTVDLFRQIRKRLGANGDDQILFIFAELASAKGMLVFVYRFNGVADG